MEDLPSISNPTVCVPHELGLIPITPHDNASGPGCLRCHGLLSSDGMCCNLECVILAMSDSEYAGYLDEIFAPYGRRS
jgi:hypothetical protein